MPLSDEVKEAMTEALNDLFGVEGEYRPVIQRECDLRHGYVNLAFKWVFAILLVIMSGVIVAYLTGGRG